MCGITGIINLDKKSVDRSLIKQLNDLITYRGPDDEGFYFDDNNGIGFGHRRLSILDLSSLGHQPMSTDDEKIWITYNGEVYNYIEIGEELSAKGYTFKSKTDTEVILKAYQEWGYNCVEKFNGMWAFAIWDSNSKKLFCSRDRFGIKPFYYFKNNNVFIFASEIKQILLHPEYKFSVNKVAVYEYLSFWKFNHTNETFYENIYQLNGSNSLILDLSSDQNNIKIQEYWDIDLEKDKLNLSEKEYSEKFYEKFYESIKFRLRSDVPVASCLSGGLDSSSIVCMVNKQLQELPDAPPQETYSSCHKDKRFDETEYVKAIEEKVNVKPNHVFPDAQTFVEELRDLIWHMDGPTVNGSIFSQRSIFKAAHKNNIKVMLDGQGGDEVLAGYHCYFAPYLLELLKEFKIIKFIKELYYLRKHHDHRAGFLFKNMKNMVTNLFTVDKNKFTWLKKDFQALALNSSKLTHYNFVSYTSDRLKNELYKLIRFTNMPALLHYEDRNSMAFSIESRVPFLDYKLVEYSFAIPNNQKIDKGTTKVILRSAFKSLLPEKILNRQDKMGFESPDVTWIHGIFKGYLDSLLDSEAAQDLDIFEIEELKKLIQSKSLSVTQLWSILGVITWYDVTTSKLKALKTDAFSPN